jgi:hypothetical protein
MVVVDVSQAQLQLSCFHSRFLIRLAKCLRQCFSKRLQEKSLSAGTAPINDILEREKPKENGGSSGLLRTTNLPNPECNLQEEFGENVFVPMNVSLYKQRIGD